MRIPFWGSTLRNSDAAPHERADAPIAGYHRSMVKGRLLKTLSCGR